MSARRILAIDPGLTVGWALADRTCGSIDVRGDGDFAAGLQAAWGAIADIVAEARPDIVVIERGFFPRLPHADVTGAIGWLAHMVARLHGCQRAEMTASAARRHFWPRHKPTDRERIALAISLGWQPRNNHEADAALLLAAWQETGGRSHEQGMDG